MKAIETFFRGLMTSAGEPINFHGSVISDKISSSFNAFRIPDIQPDPDSKTYKRDLENLTRLRRNPEDTITVHLGTKQIGRIVHEIIKLPDGTDAAYYIWFYQKPDPNNGRLVTRIEADLERVELFESDANGQLMYSRDLLPEEGLEFIADMPKGPGDAFFSPPTQPVL